MEIGRQWGFHDAVTARQKRDLFRITQHDTDLQDPPSEPTQRSHRIFRGCKPTVVRVASDHPLAPLITDSEWRVAMRFLCERAGYRRPVRTEVLMHDCLWVYTRCKWWCRCGFTS